MRNILICFIISVSLILCGYGRPRGVVKQTELVVAGMTCGSCAGHIDGILKPLPGVKEIVVDVKASRVKVTHDPAKTSAKLLAAKVTDIGYPAKVLPSQVQSFFKKGTKKAPVKKAGGCGNCCDK